MTDSQPLSQRMRELAPVLSELNQRYDYQPGYAGWGPEELLREAVHVEAEEHEAAQRDVLAADLAVAVYQARGGLPWSAAPPDIRDAYLAVAKVLVDDGWRRDA